MESTLRDLFPEFYFYQALSIREFQQLKEEMDIIFSPVPLQTEKKLFIVHRILSDFEKVQLRQRVLKEIYGLNTNVINMEQLMNTIERYATVKNKESLLNALQDHFSLENGKQEKDSQTKADLSLASILTPDRIMVKKEVVDWVDAIRIASTPLLENSTITENYIEEMIKQYPTMLQHIVLRNVIAIPHASPEAGVNKVGMSLLKIEDGIAFTEQIKVHFIVVLASTDKNKHLYALRQLMNLAKNKSQMEELFKSQHVSELYEIIKNYS
jgi:mannitol/fructose-specific phosphotransferase system IIA component (Ntr-type)